MSAKNYGAWSFVLGGTSRWTSAASALIASLPVSARCFRCRRTGHRCGDCPERRVAPSLDPSSRMVWRPVAPVTPPAAVTAATTGPSVEKPTSGDGAGPSRRRRRHRKRRNTRGAPSSTPPTNPDESDNSRADVSSGGDHQEATAGLPRQRPRCVINRSATIYLREERLATRRSSCRLSPMTPAASLSASSPRSLPGLRLRRTRCPSVALGLPVSF